MTASPLHALIGKTLDFAGRPCQVIEVIQSREGISLVLQDASARDVQPNRHGEAHRRTPRVHTVPWRIREQRNPELASLWEFVAD